MVFKTLLKEVLNLKLTKKTMKTIPTTHQDIIFTSELNEVSGFTKKRCFAGTHLSKKPTNINNIDKQV